MIRFAWAAAAVALCTLPGIVPAAAPPADIRAMPMQFEFWTEGPAEACGKTCRTWVSATGAITADTPRDFEAFAKKRKLEGITMALDSDGGSVLGALALGRAVRKLGMTTTVGKSVEVPTEGGERRGRLLPRAYCESMCAFVLLAGVERHVPAEARVLVHQIWLGDRRDDPTAANYSAEDLVLVQRDIGRLAQYTVEMGGAIDLLEIALKIPPWEPMRLLSRDELRGMKVITGDEATEASSNPSRSGSLALASGSRNPINGRSWVMVSGAERPILARKHPLTLEGEDFGTFELRFACGDTSKDYSVTYIEYRHSRDGKRAPKALTEVELALAGKSVPLKVTSSRPTANPHEIESVAGGTLSAELMRAFAEPSARSLTVETSSDEASTAIRVGNAGVSRALPQLVASCAAGRTRTRSTARTELRPGG
jgi:hypothetical protein